MGLTGINRCFGLCYALCCMKKIIFAFLFLWFLPVAALAQGVPVENVRTVIGGSATQHIKSFDVTATLSENRSLIIREEIEYDFGKLTRHGIFRHIPARYQRDGMNYDLNFRLIEVLRDGEEERYEKSKDGDMWVLKIGKAEETITGAHTYVIEYETTKAINFFDGHTELYWNVTGNHWPLPINSASFRLYSPVGGATSSLAFACYTGIMGSVESACNYTADGDSILVTADREFEKGEGLSVVFGFPPGVIKQPTRGELFWEALRDNWIIVVPVIALFVMLYLWWTRGKDPEPETVIPRYETPRDMAPIVLSGALGQGAVPQRGVTATIIDMAKRGYLHIEYGTEKKLFGEKQTYTFIKKKEPPKSAAKWDRELWNGLFKNGERERTTFDDLKNDKFYNDVQRANKAAEKQLKSLSIFDSSPYLVKFLYIMGAVIAGFVTALVGIYAPVGIAAGVVTFIIIAVFGWFMPRRTKQGTSIVAEVKGFKWFLSVTEEERLKFHNAPSRTPKQFMDFLPAAIALGVEKAWAEQFKDLHIEPPEWAEGNVASWTPILLANSIADMNTASAANVYSAPSTAGSGGSGFSSGGGFSGGGFGGGGGGSW
ncbi:DUF2207 domain-containing protein [Candidatus Uhrbacteria bacterium]|nr:DUF2207 domain-containing protein [Candidatus Uhrbacteria bacterium]